MRRFRSRSRDERGAIAIIVAVLTLVIFAIAALGVDIASQVQRKHLLKNQLDAAATAAAFHLDQETNAIRDSVTGATAYFAKNGEGTLPVGNIDFWCVVARKTNADGTPSMPAMVAPFQIPSTTSSAGVCNPDAVSANTTWQQSAYQNRVRYDGKRFNMTCSATLCAVPCALNASPSNNWNPGNSVANSQPITCNTVRVGAEQDVPFTFAPAVGVNEGSTGSQIAVACKGTCGAVAPNPMNVVVVTDRTISMKDPDLDSLIQGVKDMLGVMSPSVQFVSLGTIGRSKDADRSNYENCTNPNVNTGSVAYYEQGENSDASKSGFWVPLKFYNNYQASGGGLNTNSDLVKALNCLKTVGKNNGTYLAAPLKAAARFSLGLSGTDTTGWNVMSELNGSSRSGRVRNLVIFETDGQPFERASGQCGVTNNLTSTAPGCGNGYDVFSSLLAYKDNGTGTADSTSTNNTCPNVTPYEGASSCDTAYRDTCASGEVIGTSGSFAGYCWTLRTSGSSYNTQTKCNNAGWSWGRPTGSGTTYCYQRSTAYTPRTISYKTNVNLKTTTTTRSLIGGQDACQNFLNVANAFKSYSADTLLITVAFNLNASQKCSGNNLYNTGSGETRLPSGDTASVTTDSKTGTPFLDDILNTSGNSVAGTCKESGNGTASVPYKFSASKCNQNVTLVYTRADTLSRNMIINSERDQPVTNVLAAAAGGTDIDASTASNACSTEQERAAENGDGDFFFCAASGDDLGPVFITALSQVSDGIRLINLP